MGYMTIFIMNCNKNCDFTPGGGGGGGTQDSNDQYGDVPQTWVPNSPVWYINEILFFPFWKQTRGW